MDSLWTDLYSNIYSIVKAAFKGGAPEDFERLTARTDAEASRPIDDAAPVHDFPKYGRPLVQVGEVYGKAVAWTQSYGLIEWLDTSGRYHTGWTHSSSIKRMKQEEWRGNGGL